MKEVTAKDGKRIYYFEWNAPGGSEAKAAETKPVLSNVQHKTVQKREVAHDMADKIKQRMISQQGFAQSYITGRLALGIAGLTGEESLIKKAIDFAVLASAANRKRAEDDILTEEAL